MGTCASQSVRTVYTMARVSCVHFAECFKAGRGVKLEHCTVTDDGVRCALEFNCV